MTYEPPDDDPRLDELPDLEPYEGGGTSEVPSDGGLDAEIEDPTEALDRMDDLPPPPPTAKTKPRPRPPLTVGGARGEQSWLIVWTSRLAFFGALLGGFLLIAGLFQGARIGYDAIRPSLDRYWPFFRTHVCEAEPPGPGEALGSLVLTGSASNALAAAVSGGTFHRMGGHQVVTFQYADVGVSVLVREERPLAVVGYYPRKVPFCDAMAWLGLSDEDTKWTVKKGGRVSSGGPRGMHLEVRPDRGGVERFTLLFRPAATREGGPER